jgi:dipeptidyl aminopeptidase/acylaminoacyl peptidase
MTRRILTASITVVVLASSAYLVLDAREQTRAAAPAGRLTIDKLIDIEHPSAPVWSRDSQRVAFMSERAGVANLYVVPADGSAKPAAITVDAGGVTGVFWSADSRTIYFLRGGQLMQASADGTEMARPALGQAALRGLTPSPDGTRIAYLVGGGGGGGGGGGRGGGRGAAPPPANPPPATTGPAEIHVRALQDGSDKTIATFNGPIGAVNWMADGARLTFTTGGGGQTIRHEQTPAYSGTKIIYTVNENVPGPPADVYIVPVAGGTPAKVNAPGGGGGGRGGGTRWVDEVHVLSDRQADFKRRSIFLVDTNTGAQTLLAEDVKTTFWSIPGGAGAGSQASPNGKWVSFLSDRDGWDQLYVAAVPAVTAGSNGNGSTAPPAVQITKGPFETWRPTWSPDSTRIAFDSNEGTNPGMRHIGVATISNSGSASIRMLTSGRGTNTAPIWSPDGRKIVYQHTDPQNSADLFVVDAVTPNAKPVRLTDSLPAGLDKSAFVEPQLVHYVGADGKRVPAYLFVPKTINRAVKNPAIVWIHGDGVNQNYDGWHIQRNYAVYYSFHQYLLQQGYVVIAPDYRGSIGYGSAWRDGVYMDVGGQDFMDAAFAAHYLKTLPYVDADRVGVWGLSYGGFFTLLAVTQMPTLYRAAVDVAGVADYAMYYEDPFHGSWTESRIGKPGDNPAVYAKASPVSHIDKLARPLLVLHGTSDVNVPYLHSVRVIDEALKKGKGDLVEFMTYPGEFHYFTREHVLRDAWNRVDRFFAKNLKK